MRATFDLAVRWEAEALCEAPLRTGGADGDAETVLRFPDGRAFIQGSSIAGALRSWMKTSSFAPEVEGLFGSQAGSGSLRISDGVFYPDAEQTIRPRLHIDGKTGTAEEGRKFDLAHMQTGSRFRFTVCRLGRENEREDDALEAALAAMHRGEITLGGQKSNGFGRVSLRVRKRRFHLRDEADREAWLEDAPGGEELKLPDGRNTAYVVFTAVGRTESLLVKASQPVDEGENGSYTENIREAGKPVIPGSSLKGGLRARAELIAAYLGLDGSVIDGVFGAAANTGDTGTPGRVVARDVLLGEHSRKITRIRINKLTGGVIRSGLFREEPVSSELTLNIKVEVGCPEGCALTLYALRDLGLGLWNLGSGASIGRGRITLDEVRAETPDRSLLNLRFDENGSCSLEDPAGLAEEWLNALKEGRE